MSMLREIAEKTVEADLPQLAGQLREAEVIVEMRIRASRRELAERASVATSGEALTYQELAHALRTSVSYLKLLVAQNKIPYERLPAPDKGGKSRDGRLVRFDLDAVRRALRELQEKR